MELLFFLGACCVICFLFSKKGKGSKQVQTQSKKIQGARAGVQVRASPPRQRAYSSPNKGSNIYEDDDDLATFTMSYGYEEEESKNKTQGRWIKLGESIDIKGTTIIGGHFYLGGRLKSLDGYGTEASLVDDSLDIQRETLSFADESLGYWPKFISLSSEGRGAYLNWLSSNRSNVDTPIGYVFIYFYGIERRILVDSLVGDVDDSEFLTLFDEIKRLKGVFGDSRSFNNYSTRLLEIMCILRPSVARISDRGFSPGNDSLLFKYRLATKVNEGEPIAAELALSWIRFYPEYNLRTPARRCDVEFSKLFRSKYAKKYGEGIVVKPNKTRLKFEYWPASNSIRGVDIEQQDLPDPSMLKAPIKKLISIADSCTEELDAYSRYLGKKGSSSEDVAAILLLPDELASADNSTIISQFKKWADDSIANSKGLVSVGDFWEHTGTPLPSKLNKKETEFIQNLAKKAGYGVAPDSRFHHAKPSVDGELVLFSEGHGEFFEPSRAFNEVGMALRLGAMVANIDSHLDESELTLLYQLIDHDTRLSPVEKRSLHAYLTWRLNTPANMTGLKARLEKLGTKEKSAVSHILISVALADGKIDPGEIKQLEKIYTALGLDKSLVSSDIHVVSSTKAVLKTAPTEKMQSQQSKTGFELDEDILALHETETKDVQSMLGAIFVDEDVPEEAAVAMKNDSLIQSDEGLDTLHHSLYESLVENEKWAREEVEELCNKLGLMVDGAIETINDWSFDVVDAPVLEEDDSIYIDQEIVAELEGLKG